MKKRYLLLTLLVATQFGQAAVLMETRLQDGRQIQIQDDFTWSYVLTEAQAKVTAPSVSDAVETPSLSAQAIQDPALLGTVAGDGVKLELTRQQPENDQLGLDVRVSNLATGSVVKISGYISFYSPQGTQLARHQVTFWQAEYRLPETYLRSHQTRAFRTIWLPLPQGLRSPLVRLEISTVERRS
jgi:hypothetical protein